MGVESGGGGRGDFILKILENAKFRCVKKKVSEISSFLGGRPSLFSRPGGRVPPVPLAFGAHDRHWYPIPRYYLDLTSLNIYHFEHFEVGKLKSSLKIGVAITMELVWQKTKLFGQPPHQL